MDLHNAIGLGVAGNFTGHLEQAGEAADFAGLSPAPRGAPKGVFPFYLPGGGSGPLHTYPLSDSRIGLPASGESVQLEPEVALICHLSYVDGKVATIQPRKFAAYDDCSIRREGACKISEKKNWGAASKGVSGTTIEIDRFEPGGVLDRYRIACWLQRQGRLHEYGVDSPVAGYSYFYGTLLDWLVQRLSSQTDEGPLEDIPGLIAGAGRPDTAVISVGATRYTPFGESHYVQAGDVGHVAVYDGSRWNTESVRGAIEAARGGDGLSLLSQRVE